MATIQLQDVKDRLEQFGYVATAADDALLTFTIEKVMQHIKNQTNQCSVPDGAYYISIDMVVGEFLQLKYSMGQLDTSIIDFGGGAVAEVRDGDTNVKYAIDAKSSPEANFAGFISGLINSKYNWGIWRRMRWC